MKNNVEREALQKERMVVKELSEMITRLQEELQILEKAVTDSKSGMFISFRFIQTSSCT